MNLNVPLRVYKSETHLDSGLHESLIKPHISAQNRRHLSSKHTSHVCFCFRPVTHVIELIKCKTVTWMQCKSLWIKASAKCINVNVNACKASIMHVYHDCHAAVNTLHGIMGWILIKTFKRSLQALDQCTWRIHLRKCPWGLWEPLEKRVSLWKSLRNWLDCFDLRLILSLKSITKTEKTCFPPAHLLCSSALVTWVENTFSVTIKTTWQIPTSLWNILTVNVSRAKHKLR